MTRMYTDGVVRSQREIALSIAQSPARISEDETNEEAQVTSRKGYPETKRRGRDYVKRLARRLRKRFDCETIEYWNREQYMRFTGNYVDPRGEFVGAIQGEEAPFEWAIRESWNPKVIADCDRLEIFAEPYNGWLLIFWVK